MLVVISSEAPKKRKIYHKMRIYAERIKFQNRLEIKVEQAEKRRLL